ncbi:hypothetical protein SAMN02745116_01347 [Pilibacter termitis]|uniref:Uncharacterized protein n=1 Tax=Pilibacter termitis TaxID=263852 RepID=A0A1T4N8M6_9ENTE|nr:hypothetical protein [Pilibacter termitis]SJZ75584.1 hypothetical protein SAMN02745116_01347 [Pilibacter termitis]
MRLFFMYATLSILYWFLSFVFDTILLKVEMKATQKQVNMMRGRVLTAFEH